MTAIMNVAEIEALYAAEWVLLEEPKTDSTLAILEGKVRYHSKDRDEVYREAIALRMARFAVLYTGQLPDNTAVIL